LIRNSSGKTIRDLHLKLISPGDTFDPNSSGGGAFNKKTLSADKTEIVFEGGNIQPGQFLWSMIPLSQPFEGGKGKYMGRATEKAPDPDEKRQEGEGIPKSGNDNTPQIDYDGTGTFNFQPGNINFVEYADGSVIRANNALESIIGSQITIGSMQLVEASPDHPVHSASQTPSSPSRGAEMSSLAPL
jgi:hypothetical protein